MLPDPAKPQLQPPRDSVQKFSTIGSVATVGVAVATVILIRLLKGKINNSVETIAPLAGEPAVNSDVATNAVQNTAGHALAKTPESKPPPIQIATYPSGVLPIDIKRDKLRDYGALILAVASLALTGLIAYYAHGINKNQAASMEEEINLRLVDEFKKHLADLTLSEVSEDLTDPDVENKKKQNVEIRRKKLLASIALAQYGERVLPALKMSLASEDPLVREGAAVVAKRMLGDKQLRQTVFAKLLEYFDDPSMRLTVLEFFVGLYNGLTDQEVNEASSKFKQHVTPDADYKTKPRHEQDVLLEATKFFANSSSRNSAYFLLAVVKNTTCEDDPREQALNFLPQAVKEAKDFSPDEQGALQKQVIADLEKLLPQASERLQVNIRDAIAELS
ncbi:MAG TPA: hypothetical protein VHH35_02815 [Pyrinomonadaceae bacterium]|nr:hypothetical protein [Pyrinomonadaceae bacterium]